MTKDACKYCGDYKDIVFETDNWEVVLNEDQTYLGRCWIILKRHCASLGELTQEEWEEFGQVVSQYETVLNKAFHPLLFNWNCFMNDAYMEKPFNPHVHWHVRPRYENPVEFAGELFEDTEFGHRFDPTKKREVSLDVRNVIVDAIKNSI